MELGMVDAVEEEEEKNLELDHYFRRTLQSSMASMADNVQAYPNVTLRNDTPYDTTKGPEETLIYYSGCDEENIREGITSGYTWMGPKRGVCLVTNIFAPPWSVPTIPRTRTWNPPTQVNYGVMIITASVRLMRNFLLFILMVSVVFEAVHNPKSVHE